MQEKLVELELQKAEFNAYMDRVQARLESCATSPRIRNDMARIRADFELERCRYVTNKEIVGVRLWPWFIAAFW